MPAGTAFTSRTFRYVSLPFFPEGIDIYPPGPGNILTDGGVTKFATNLGAPLPVSAFQSIQGFNDFNPNTNFHQPYPQTKGNQNGVVLFPGSAPLYKDTTGSGIRSTLIGGLGVSGDGVFQDDDVTSVASIAYAPPRTIDRADQVKVRGVRLPYYKYNRNPHLPFNGPEVPDRQIQESSLASSAEKARPINRREPMRPSLWCKRPWWSSILAAGHRRPSARSRFAVPLPMAPSSQRGNATSRQAAFHSAHG